MHKFTKESLLLLSKGGEESRQAVRTFQSKMEVMMKMNVQTKSYVLTWNMNDSINQIDEFLELIQQMNHKPIKRSTLERMIMVLKSNVDYCNLRQNRIIFKISSKIYEMSLNEADINLMILFGNVIYYLSSEKENFCQFHQDYQRIIEKLLEANNPEANCVGVDILNNIVKINGRITIDFSLDMVKNIELYFMKKNDWKQFIQIMKNQKKSIKLISVDALKKIIDYEKEYSFLLDGLHYNQQIAYDNELFDIFIKSFHNDENIESKKGFYASLCNFIQINKNIIYKIIVDENLMKKLTHEISHKDNSNYVSLICAYITIDSSISFDRLKIINSLKKWIHEINGNDELKFYIKTILNKLKGVCQKKC